MERTSESVERDVMSKLVHSAAPAAIALAALLAASTTLHAEETPSSSSSPYDSGPPPVTDGYTDTSQGGTKGSGDAPIPPASKDGKVVIHSPTGSGVPTSSPLDSPSD